jgi:hypothetical protein
MPRQSHFYHFYSSHKIVPILSKIKPYRMCLYVIHTYKNLTMLNYVNSLNYKLQASIAGYVNSLGTFHLYGCVLVQGTGAWVIIRSVVLCRQAPF